MGQGPHKANNPSQAIYLNSVALRINYTVDGFIFVGTNSCGLNKIKHSWGLKFVVIVFSFIILTENRYFLGTENRGSDPPRKPRKLVPREYKVIHSICVTYDRKARNLSQLHHKHIHNNNNVLHVLQKLEYYLIQCVLVSFIF